MNLFRGAEYQRFSTSTKKEPLTYYDMNLSAQDHQTFFTCEYDAGKPEYESKEKIDFDYEASLLVYILNKLKMLVINNVCKLHKIR